MGEPASVCVGRDSLRYVGIRGRKPKTVIGYSEDFKRG